MAFLEIHGVHKRFGDLEVLRGVDLTVEQHQVVSLIGASGSGKSTLLRCINGLETINDGVIRLEGMRVSGRGIDLDAVRRVVGIVFQSFNLFPHMSVIDNITLAPRKVLGVDPADDAFEARLALRNGRGGRALQKLGAVQEGLLRKAALVGGELLDDHRHGHRPLGPDEDLRDALRERDEREARRRRGRDRREADHRGEHQHAGEDPLGDQADHDRLDPQPVRRLRRRLRGRGFR